MKKVASIVAIVVFALGLFATQINDNIDLGIDIENMLACGDCDPAAQGKRGGTA